MSNSLMVAGRSVDVFWVSTSSPITADPAGTETRSNGFEAFVTALRVPGRLFADIASIARALVAIQRIAKEHVARSDARAGTLTAGLGDLRASLRHIEYALDNLMGLESTIVDQVDALRRDINVRALALERDVRALGSPLEIPLNGHLLVDRPPRRPSSN